MAASTGPSKRWHRYSKRKSIQHEIRAGQPPCHLCGFAIDYAIPARHPLCFEMDEVVPVSKGGDPYDPGNVKAAHRCCNQWRGDKDLTRQLRDAIRARFMRTYMRKRVERRHGLRW